MSFAQSRLWILDRFQPGNPAYNIATSVPLYGRVDARVLERTINEIIRRHEALRTTFEVVDGQPAQVVKASLKIPLNMVDLRSRSGVARAEEIDHAPIPKPWAMRCDHTPTKGAGSARLPGLRHR